MKRLFHCSIYKPILAIAIFVHFSPACYSQQTDPGTTSWEKLLSDYKNGQITVVQYLDKIDTLAFSSVYLTDLKERLETYKSIIWKHKQHKWRRQQYYWYLELNGQYTEKQGLSAFYQKKRLKELGVTDSVKTKYSIAISKLHSLAGSLNNKKAIEIFESIRDYAETLTDNIKKGESSQGVGYTLAAIISQIISNYIAVNDSVNTNQLTKLSEQIYQNLYDRKDKYQSEYIIAELLMHITRFKKELFWGRNEEAEKIIKTAYSLNSELLQSSAGNRELLEECKKLMLHDITHLYLSVKNEDSASKYLSILNNVESELKNNPVFNNIRYLKYSAQLSGLKNDYKTAYNTLLEVVSISDSINDRRLGEISDYMYAQAELGDAQENIITLNEEKSRRNTLLIIGAFLLLLSAILLYSLLKRRSHIAKTKIDMLNNAFQIQIVEMEERSREALEAEQKKLGRELHDELAGNLAGVKARMEAEIQQSDNEFLRQRLASINQLINIAYEITRDKSHSLYKMTNEQSPTFSDKLKVLLENGLPHGKFENEVMVDRNAINILDLDKRIELLYIIREALTNIIKHAEANKISILIYEDLPGIILQITDNGKGFNPQSSKAGLGLKSIRERAASINATVAVNSSHTGTEITVTVPAAA